MELQGELGGGGAKKEVKKSNSAFQGHHHLKTTYITSRRAMAAPAGSSVHNLGNLFATTNTGRLGRMSPLTGSVETGNRNNHQNDSDAWKRLAKSDFVGATSTGVIGENGTSGVESLTSHHQNKLVMVSVGGGNQIQTQRRGNESNTNNNNRSGSGGGSRVPRNPHDDITQGMRNRDPKWFEPVTKSTASTARSGLVPQVPSSQNNNNNRQSKFTNVPVHDTLKEFFLLNNSDV